ncbi:MAG TPA: DNA helicase RecQ [Thermoanaerobaculia bacterium]|nr:DNA helicase RecQ [Thermoanaerobaculia bacterium]
MPNDALFATEATESTETESGAEPRLRELLRRTWGYADFRPLQREAMAAVLARRDSVVVLPTGGGKSVCYQAPALLEEGGGPAVVVSPLISLMKDQVDGLVANGVAAACFHSAMSPEERREVRTGLGAGRYRLLYVSPERLVGEGGGFRAWLRGRQVPFFAIDEAHCISQWGHDFRPSYRELGRLKEEFPGSSIHAFTATATARVREDICAQLGLAAPEVLVGSFDRPNLVYRVERRRNLDAQLRAVIDRHPGEAGIVYCISRREVESLADRLQSWGVSARPYHAGLADADRSRHQEEFSQARVDVIVATVAFGMGIDRSDVRFVVHVASPRSLEHYQQESGRAGRDGLPAECALIYSPSDFHTWRRLVAQDGELTDNDRRLLSDMQRYASLPRCRHRALVEYFGQRLERGDCGACDHCLGELDDLERVEDGLVVGQKVLSCVLRVRESFGVTHVMDVLRGRDTDKVRERAHDQLSTFGLLADESPRQVRGWIEQLLDQGFLEQAGDRYPVLHVTSAGRELLKGREAPDLYREPKRAAKSRRESKADAESWEGVDRPLFDTLRDLRLEIARERGVPPYVIFHDSMLRDMARVRPTTQAELLTVYGVGEKKAADLGPKFLGAIRDHLGME